MVKTLLKTSFREIRQSLGRFLAILAIVGLGVGFFAGLRMCQPDMVKTGSDYLEAQKMHDFQLLSTLGFTQKDVDAFAEIEGISNAQGAVFTDFLTSGRTDQDVVMKAHSLTDGINLPKLTSGRMPEKPNECLGDARYFSEEDLGTVIPISPENSENTLDLLAYDEYILVGTMYSPAYLNYERGTASLGNGNVAAFVYIPEEGFDFNEFYEIYLTMDDPAPAYSEEYDQQRDALKPTVEATNRDRAELRYEDVYGEAMDKISEAEQELADGWAEFNDKKAEVTADLESALHDLNDGEKKYADGLSEFKDGEAQYADGLKQYEDGLAELNDAKADLDQAKADLEEAKQQLADAEKALAEGKDGYQQVSTLYAGAQQMAQSTGMGTPQRLIAVVRSGYVPILNGTLDAILQQQGSSLNEFLLGWSAAESSLGQPLTPAALSNMRSKMEHGQQAYEDGLAQYEDGKAQYEDGLQQYEDGLAELNDAKTDLDSAKSDLSKAKRDLGDARSELDDGWSEYNDGVSEAEKEFADAEAELLDGEAELEEAKLKLEDLKDSSIFTLTRNENIGYVCFDNDTSIVAAISLVFPVFFFLVAALVCMTTMTRMVDEQRTQIGVLKALGYSNGQIMGKYIFYSGSAAIVGSAIGYAVGSRCLPWIIWEIYGIMYGFAPLESLFDPMLALISFAAALLCSIGATYFSCSKELRRQAAELIRPKTPKAGRRVFLEYITPLWKRLSFLHKVSLRNVLRYRSRLIMMVLGIGGCTALLATGFGIRDSVKFVADDQFDEITVFDYSVTFAERQDPESIAEYLSEVGWDEDQSLLVHSSSVTTASDSGSKSAYLISSYTGEYDGFVDLHSGETPVAPPAPGEVVLNVGLANTLNIKEGDVVHLTSDTIGDVEVKVSAICDNYVQNYVYVHPQTFEEQSNTPIPFKTLYLLAHEDADPYLEGTILSDNDAVGSVAVNQTTRDQVDSMLARMDYIILVVVICAAALAFIVLYNLTNINITERMREIATIKVLGFYRNEVAAYVFREINILSIVGSLAGLLMGKALHMFVMSQIRIDSMFFPCRIAPLSYLFALLMTLLFTLLISTAMRPRLRRIDMAESLKSIE